MNNLYSCCSLMHVGYRWENMQDIMENIYIPFGSALSRLRKICVRFGGILNSFFENLELCFSLSLFIIFIKIIIIVTFITNIIVDGGKYI